MAHSTTRDTEGDETSIKAAKNILSSREDHSCEMWCRLAKACNNAQVHQEAADCAMKALDILDSPESISYVHDCPGLPRKQWYWLAVAEVSLGEVSFCVVVKNLKDPTDQKWMFVHA